MSKLLNQTSCQNYYNGFVILPIYKKKSEDLEFKK
jgi:hypothetical protein